MDTITNLEKRIFANSNTFTFFANVKTIQLYILNLILLVDSTNIDYISTLLQRIDNKSNFDSFAFLRKYVINTYFSKMYSDVHLKAILSYFNSLGYLNNNSLNKVKLLRYIQQKLNKNIFRLTIYLDEKSQIKNIEY